MLSKKSFFIILLFGAAVSMIMSSYSPGATSTSTGNQSNSNGTNCTSCHSSFALNTSKTFITTNIPAEGYKPDSTYTVTVSTAKAGITKYGFQVHPTDSFSTLNFGNIIVTNVTTTQAASGLITHTGSGNAFPTGTANWSFNWKAPSTSNQGPVRFYGTVVAANQDFSSANDEVFAYSLKVSEMKSSISIAITSGSNPTCSSNSITFAATSINAGASPSYQWKIGAVNVGTNSPTYTLTTPVNNSDLTCVVSTSNGLGMKTSNKITILVNSTNSTTLMNGCDSVLWNGTTYKKSGIYTYTTLNSAGCDSFANLHLSLSPTPKIASITASANPICAGDSMTLKINAVKENNDLTFNGTNSYVNCGAMPSLNSIQKFTFEAMINPSNKGLNKNILSKRLSHGNCIQLQFDQFILSGLGCITFSMGDGGTTKFGGACSHASIPLNQWTHVAAVYDGTGATNADKMKIYIDGVAQTLTFYYDNGTINTTGVTIPSTTPTNASNTLIGSEVTATSTSIVYSGKMNDVRVWNISRTAADINTYKNTCLTGNLTGLIGNYKMDETTGSTSAVNDFGTLNNGTLVNFTTTTCWNKSTAGCGFTKSWNNGVLDNINFAPTASMSYKATLSNVYGCSDTSSVNLVVFPKKSSSFTQTICGNQFYVWNGIAQNATGAYADTFPSFQNCDSVVTLNLTVNPVKNSSFTQSICANQSYTWNDIVRNTSGAYLDTFMSAQNCDSIVTLNLNVVPAKTSSFSKSICPSGSYTWNGIVQTTAGAYLDTFASYQNCDSIVTLNLSISPNKSSSFSKTICSNKSFIWNGINQTTSGAYLDTFLTSTGCDSIVTLNLTVNPTKSSSFSQTICANKSYLWNGVAQNIAGGYLDTFLTTTGCDSIVTLNLILNPTKYSSVSQTICSNQSYLWNGILQNTAGAYKDTFLTSTGCDSVVILNLFINLTKSSSFSQTICAGKSYTYNGIVQTTSGAYKDTFPAVNGCDSIVTLNLIVSPLISSTFNLNICAGKSYLWNGINRNTSGQYKDTFTSVNNCDSVVILSLTVYPVIASSFSKTICYNQSYLWNGIAQTTSGSYKDTFTSYQGCDSIVTLNLTVNPALNKSTTTVNKTITAAQSGATYQWMNCTTNSNILGATFQSYIATANGSYKVAITQNSCKDTSLCVTISGMGIQDNSIEKSIIIYPNPSSESFTIQSSIQSTISGKYKLVNELGQVFKSFELNVSNHFTEKVENLVSGVYYLQMENGVVIGKKIVVVR
jgi:hypothetical protein